MKIIDYEKVRIEPGEQNNKLKTNGQMKVNGKNENTTIGEDSIKDQHEHKFHRRLIHHSFIFWIFALLMLVGILYFVMSLGFFTIPQL